MVPIRITLKKIADSSIASRIVHLFVGILEACIKNAIFGDFESQAS